MNRALAPCCLFMTLLSFASRKSFAQAPQTAALSTAQISSTPKPEDRTIPFGAVEGVVLDQQSKPIPGADVYALLEEDMRTRAGTTTTNSAGKFILRDLPAARVYIYAFKEKDNYPNGFAEFFVLPNDQSLVPVKVEAGQTTTLTIKRGARSAHLKVHITDENGKRIGAALTLEREDQPGRHYGEGTDGEVSMLVPPVPFRATIEADGYAPWHYGGADWQGKAGLIALKSGQGLNLRVHLPRTNLGKLYDKLIQPSETNSAAAEFAKLDKNDPDLRSLLTLKLPSLIFDQLPINNVTVSPVWANAVRLAGQLKLEYVVPVLARALTPGTQLIRRGYDIPDNDTGYTFTRGARLDFDIVGRALADIGDPSVHAVAEILSTGDFNARRRAMWILINIDSPSSEQAMRDHLPGENDPVIKGMIEHALHVW
jgi:hypothetical protein